MQCPNLASQETATRALSRLVNFLHMYLAPVGVSEAKQQGQFGTSVFAGEMG